MEVNSERTPRIIGIYRLAAAVNVQNFAMG